MSQILKEARHTMGVLVAGIKGQSSSQLRQALMQIGFNEIIVSPSFAAALAEVKSKPISLVFFDGEAPKTSDVTSTQFAEICCKLKKDIYTIAVCNDASGDKMFGLLKVGTKGFLLPPFIPGAIEDVFLRIQSGIEMSKDVLTAEDRNAKFAEIIYDQLNKTVEILAEAKKNLNIKSTEKITSPLQEFVRMAKFFCEQSESALVNKIHEHFIERASKIDEESEKTRLRNTREMLKQRRNRENRAMK
jgi:hypothetical protein